MLRGGLVGSLFPGLAHACCPDLVPGGQGQPPCPSKSQSRKFIVKTHAKGQGGTPPERWGDCLRRGLDLLGSSDSTDQTLKDSDRGILGRVACPHLP